MAAIDDLLKESPLGTVAIGVGILVLAPVVLPIVGRLSKPLVKEFIKQGYLIYEKTREGLAEVAELAEDAVAEARVQLELEALAGAGGGAEAPAGPGGNGAVKAGGAGPHGAA